MMQVIDDLIKKMKSAKYEYGFRGGNESSTLLYGHGTAEQVMRQILLEFIQQNTNDIAVENSQLKQRVFILEEIVKKSNFAPLIAPIESVSVPKTSTETNEK
jgi:hypothetical protein